MEFSHIQSARIPRRCLFPSWCRSSWLGSNVSGSEVSWPAWNSFILYAHICSCKGSLAWLGRLPQKQLVTKLRGFKSSPLRLYCHGVAQCTLGFCNAECNPSKRLLPAAFCGSYNDIVKEGKIKTLCFSESRQTCIIIHPSGYTEYTLGTAASRCIDDKYSKIWMDKSCSEEYSRIVNNFKNSQDFNGN